MAVLRLSPADLLEVRFATSPLWELTNAVRITTRPTGQRWHLPWLAGVAGTEPPPGLAVLQALQPRAGHTPDFIAPTPFSATGNLVDEVARAAATPPERVAIELLRTRESQLGTPAVAVLDRLLEDPAAARDEVCAALLAAWDALLAPHWPRIRALLDADVAFHAQRLAQVGLRTLVAELHPRVRWSGDDVEVMWRAGEVGQVREVAGAGLVLMPSAFTWPNPVAIMDEPWQPTLVYPARGVGALWEERRDAPEALVGVLGATRAMLLADLAEPASTTVLAERHHLATSTLSRHLQLLEAAGLVVARRSGREVHYRRTPLGAALVEPDGSA